MTDESLIAPKNPDGFTTESPIRAFTDFQVNGLYAIGKGFRPSLAHMTAYMSAMETKEGWQLVQVILPRDNDGEPTMLFRKVVPPMYIMQTGELPEDFYKTFGEQIRGMLTEGKRTIGKSPALAMPYGDDPIHPKHYDGVACCEIIDHMPTNVGLAGKYIWRLGEKDPIAQEIGKLIFYLKRQLDLEAVQGALGFQAKLGMNGYDASILYQEHCRARINGRFGNSDFDVHRATAMTALVHYTTGRKVKFLENAIEEMGYILKLDGITTGLAV